ncbi:MAG: aldehyde dehydrogenase family protein [Lachnospiraceae bacterium]|nr:aldehyde dehydrogenase family protein [Lachnospiraceae bacterium]
MEAKEYVEGLVEKARAAQKQIENYTQEQVDALCREIARTVYDNAEMLAKMAVEETRMGIYENKVAKNKGKARVIWNDLKGKKSVGIINRYPEQGIIEVAKPMGVVAAITPTTNPIVTPMCNAMFAVKGRNAIIVGPHPRSRECSTKTVELINERLAKLGAPENLIQCVPEPTMEISGLLMKTCDVVLATGGPGVVKAAYSSGKPSYGVGAGNVQCILDDDVDYAKTVPMIIEGRIFDNGIICSGEQNAITPAAKADELIAEYKKNGGVLVDDPAQIDALREAMFPGGVMNKDLVGQSALKVAEAAGIKVPSDTRVLLVKAPAYGKEDYFSKEKMCPVMSLYTYNTWEEAIAIADANLAVEGRGHSVAIHSNNQEHIEAAAEVLPVSRFLINQVCATNNGGSLFNSLSATTTLGCGSWGGNTISENLSWKHLFNVSRIATVRPGAAAPTDEEIWG